MIGETLVVSGTPGQYGKCFHNLLDNFAGGMLVAFDHDVGVFPTERSSFVKQFTKRLLRPACNTAGFVVVNPVP